MSDRLSQLLRQRALMQEHLAWLDREIADASASSVTPLPTAAVPVPASTPVTRTSAPLSPLSNLSAQASAILQRPPHSPIPSPEVLPEADDILEQYRVAPDAMKTDVRKGCLLYFFGALALLALGAVAFYYANHRA